MHPIRFVKAHPLATVVIGLAGMAVGPTFLSFVGDKTGVNLSVRQYGAGS
jgi:hypothetical protein